MQCSQAQCTTRTISLAARCTPRTIFAHYGFDTLLIPKLIPLKNQKEQGGAPQIVRVCTARRDNTVIFDLAMEYLVELLVFS